MSSQPGGAQSPCQAIFGDGGGDDVRDVNEGLTVVSNADAEAGRYHGLDVVVGVAKRDGVGQRNATCSQIALMPTAFDRCAGTTSKGT